MTSAINPNNIDSAYPVAGQDNDSQGFRDNFTNIKTNFEYAGSEITDLQNKVLLKAALTGSTLNNNLNGAAYQRGTRISIRALDAFIAERTFNVSHVDTCGQIEKQQNTPQV